MVRVHLSLLVTLPIACATPTYAPIPSDTGTAMPARLDPGMELGPRVRCTGPGGGIDDLQDIGTEVGIDRALPTVESVFGRPSAGAGGSVSIADIDVDGDLDLLIGGLDGAPDLYLNDGSGWFQRRTLSLERAGGTHALHVADMDADGWPDLVAIGSQAGGGVYRNAGGYRFPLVAPFEDIPMVMDSVIMTGMVGDLDGDGDLDIAIPTMSAHPPPEEPGAPRGAPDLLLLQDAPMTFSLGAALVGPEGPTTSQAGWLTDRDEDGDLDLMVLPDQGPAATWWRSDGGLPEQEDAADVLGALRMAAMGLDSADIDGDGYMDVCISDVGTPRCLTGAPGGNFVDATALLELPVDEPIPLGPEGLYPTIGWSIALVDLDADGNLDLLQSSGPEEGAMEAGFDEIGDVLWRGLGGTRFEDRSHESGFWDVSVHVGLATGDLDGDGFLEIVRAGPGSVPRVHSMPCTGGGWLQVRLQGPASGTTGLGARVTVEAGERIWREEVLGVRDKAQGAAWQTFGLGDRGRVDRVVVTWPDGTQQTADDVPTRRTLTVAHPAAVRPEPYPTH